MNLKPAILVLSLVASLPACAHPVGSYASPAEDASRNSTEEAPSYFVNVSLKYGGTLISQYGFPVTPEAPMVLSTQPEIPMPGYSTVADALELRIGVLNVHGVPNLDVSVQHSAIRGFNEIGDGQMYPRSYTYRQLLIMPADGGVESSTYKIVDGEEYQLSISASKIRS